MIKPLYILIVILLLASFCYAQPPFEAPQLGGTVDIEFPKFDYIKLGSAYVLHVHAHNVTDGLLLTNDTTSCTMHLYNQSDHLIEENMVFSENGYDFEYHLGHALNKTGVYSYLVYCNTTYQGGYVSAAFDVTDDGRETLPDQNMLPITGAIVTIIVFFFMLGFLNPAVKLKLISFGVGLIEILVLQALVYMREIGINTDGLMMVNFYSLLFIGFGIGMISIFHVVAQMMNLEDREDDEPDKWGRDGWKK